MVQARLVYSGLKALRGEILLVVKAAGSQLGKCLVVLSKLSFEAYCRSAATTAWCSNAGVRADPIVLITQLEAFFEKRVAKCEIEGSYANAQFRNVTR